MSNGNRVWLGIVLEYAAEYDEPGKVRDEPENALEGRR